MGNDQSRGGSSEQQEAPKVLNYYELLQIDEEATFDEIKVNKIFQQRGQSLICVASLP
jgi:hypothetical protein